MRSDLRLLLVLAVATCGTGCANAPDVLFGEAVRSFGRVHSCPDDRLQVRHAHVWLSDLVESKQPPAEVAADAGRLAVWNRAVNQDLGHFDRLTAVHVAGCGSQAIYFCWYGHLLHRDHECLPMDLDDADPEFAGLALKRTAGQQVRQRLGLPPGLPAPPSDEVAQPMEPPPSSGDIKAAVDAKIRAMEKEMRRRMDAMAKETSATIPAPKPAPPPNR